MTAAIVPPATIGVLGGGQLGRYAVMAARTMGYRTMVLEPDPDAPAGKVADKHLVNPYDDEQALAYLAHYCAVVTTEFENPPAHALALLAESTVVAPRPETVAICQDRRAEKRALAAHGFPVGRFAVIDAADHLARAAGCVPFPAILKTARLGYDGKGQRTIASSDELADAWDDLGHVPCVLEERLHLTAELSALVARTADGRCAVYPIAENVHRDGILDLTVVPARVDAEVAQTAADLALHVAETLDFVGVLAVEMFVVTAPDGHPSVLVNELAPRPHNSGHWTLDACATSQFEQQIRAVCGLGLGSTRLTAPAVAMVNLLGDRWPQRWTAHKLIVDLAERAGLEVVTVAGEHDKAEEEPDWAIALADSDAKLHLYGKGHPRRGRKMGHLTVTGPDPDTAAERALALRAALTR